MPMKGRDEKRWLKDGGRKLAKSRRAERSSVSSGSSSGDAASSSSGRQCALCASFARLRKEQLQR